MVYVTEMKRTKKPIEEKIDKLERELNDLDSKVNSKKVETSVSEDSVTSTILDEPLSNYAYDPKESPSHQHTVVHDPKESPSHPYTVVYLPQGTTLIEADRLLNTGRQLPDNEIWSVTPRSGTVPVRLIDARARSIISTDEYHHAIKNYNLQPDDSIWVRKDFLTDEKDRNCKKIINLGKGEIIVNINEKDEYTQGQRNCKNSGQRKPAPGQLGTTVTLTYNEG